MSVLDKLHRNDQAFDVRPEAELKKLFGKAKNKRERETESNERQDENAAERLVNVALDGASNPINAAAKAIVGGADPIAPIAMGTQTQITEKANDVVGRSKSVVTNPLDAAQGVMGDVQGRLQGAANGDLSAVLGGGGPQLSAKVGGFDVGVDLKPGMDGNKPTLGGGINIETPLGKNGTFSAQASTDNVLTKKPVVEASAGVQGTIAQGPLGSTVDVNAEVSTPDLLAKKKQVDGRLGATANVGGFDVSIAETDVPLVGHESTQVMQQRQGRSNDEHEGKEQETDETNDRTAARDKLAKSVLDGGAVPEGAKEQAKETIGLAETASEMQEQESDETAQQQGKKNRLARVALDREEEKVGHEAESEEVAEKKPATDKDNEKDKDADRKKAKNDPDAPDDDESKDKDKAKVDFKLKREEQETAEDDGEEKPGKVGRLVKKHEELVAKNGKTDGVLDDEVKQDAKALKKAAVGKTDGDHVDGHGMGLVIDDPKQQKKLTKTDGKVDGHGTGLDIDPTKKGKTDGTLVDGHGTGLLVDQDQEHQGGLTDAEGNQVPYTPGKAAPTPQASKGAHPGGFAKPKAPPEPPAIKPQTPTQEAMQSFIDKARKDRDAATSTVQAQKLQKSQQVNVDANVIKAQVESANNKKLAELRKKAEADKAAAAKKAEEQQKAEGPATIESLKQKLETESTADKERLKQSFDTKKSELTIRLQTQKETLQNETKKQIENWKTQEESKKKQLQAAFDKNKVEWEANAKKLQEQMTAQVKADKERLDKEKKTLETKTAERMKDLETKANNNAKKIVDDGETKAKGLEQRGRDLGAAEMTKARNSAANIRSTAAGKAAGVEDEGQKKSIIAAANNQANGVMSAAETRAGDLIAKGEKDGKDARAEAKKQSEDLIAKGKKAVADANAIAQNQVKAIDDKIGQLKGLADERIKKAQTDLDEKVKKGLEGIKKAQDESKAKIDKLQQETETKLAALEGDAMKKMQADYDKELAAIDKRVEAARQKLATAKDKDVAAMQKMVEQTLQQIDKGIEATEKKFDGTVQDAEKKAQAFVLAQLQKIKAEADKALADIDRVFDGAMETLKQMQEQVHRDIEEMSKGKMLEVEVHTATLLADIGDKSKLDAVRKTIQAYVEAGRPLPAGYAQTAKPEPKLGPDGKPVEEKKEEKPGDTVAELVKLEDPAKKPGEQKLGPDGKPIVEEKKEKSPEELQKELDAKVDAEIKKAQTQTSLAAHENATATIKQDYDKAEANMKTFVEGKQKEQDSLARGDKDAVEKAENARKAKEAGAKAADELNKAMDGWGTDEKKIFASLKGKSPEEIEAIKEAYKAKTGRDLEADLLAELSDTDLKEARALLSGDPVRSRVAAIQNSLSFWGNDRDKIKDALYGGTPPLTPEQRQQLIKQYEQETGQRLDKMLGDEGLTGDNTGIKAEDFAKQEKPLTDEEKAAISKAKESPGVASAIEKLKNATIGDRLGTNEANVYAALQGKSPAEIAAIKELFKKETGQDLDDVLESEMSGAELKEAKALMSGDPVQIAVAKLDNAAHGGIMPGTDTAKINQVLEGITDPEQRRKVKEEYERSTGQKLDEMLDDELSGFDKDLAKAHASGDPAQVAAVKADKAMHGGFLTDIADGIADTVGVDRKIVREGLGTGLVAAVAGPFAPAIFALQAAGITNFGTDTGTDEKALYEALESCPDEYSRQKLREAYKARTGKDLDIELKGELSGAEADVAKYIMDGDTVSAEAAKMKAGAEGLGTDKKMIYAALEKCKTPEERQRLIAKYNELYGKDGENFDQMLKNELAPSPASTIGWGAIGFVIGGPAGAALLASGQNDLDYQKAKLLSEGKMDDGFALYYAMNEGMLGVGTDDDALRKIIKGPPQKTKAEIEKLKQQYAEAAKKYGGKDNANLFDDVMGETSGRLAHELEWGMKGKPETPEEMRAKAQADLDFERNDTSWVGEVGCMILLGPLGYGAMKAMGYSANDLANGITDAWSDSGTNLESSHAEFEAKYAQLLADPRFADRDKYPPGSPERIAMDKAMMAELERSMAKTDANLEDFQAAKDATADAAGTVVAVAVGAALTIASGGALGPVAIALISGTAGLAATMAIKGGSMSNEEIGQAVVAIVAEALAAGLVDVKAVKGLIGNVSALAGGEKALAGRVINEMLEEAIESGAEAMVTAIADPANYKGDPVDWLKNVSAATAKAAGTGAFSAGVSSGLGDKWNPNGPLGKAIKGGTMQMVGGTAAAAIDPATYEGSQDEKWGRFAKSQAEAGLRGAYNSFGGGDTSKHDPGHDEYNSSKANKPNGPSDTNTTTNTDTAAASTSTDTKTDTKTDTTNTAAPTTTTTNTDTTTNVAVNTLSTKTEVNTNLNPNLNPNVETDQNADQSQKDAKRNKKLGSQDQQTDVAPDISHVLNSMADPKTSDLTDRNTVEAINQGLVDVVVMGSDRLLQLEPGLFYDPVTDQTIVWSKGTAAAEKNGTIYIDPAGDQQTIRELLRHEANHALNKSDISSKLEADGMSRFMDEVRAHAAEKAGPNPTPEQMRAAIEDALARVDANYQKQFEGRPLPADFRDAAMNLESLGNTINSVRLVPVYKAVQHMEAFGEFPSAGKMEAMISKLDAADRHALGGDPMFRDLLNMNPNLTPQQIAKYWDMLGTDVSSDVDLKNVQSPTATNEPDAPEMDWKGENKKQKNANESNDSNSAPTDISQDVANYQAAVDIEKAQLLGAAQKELARRYTDSFTEAYQANIAAGLDPEQAVVNARKQAGKPPFVNEQHIARAEALAQLRVTHEQLRAMMDPEAALAAEIEHRQIENDLAVLPPDIRTIVAKQEREVEAKMKEVRAKDLEGHESAESLQWQLMVAQETGANGLKIRSLENKLAEAIRRETDRPILESTLEERARKEVVKQEVKDGESVQDAADAKWAERKDKALEFVAKKIGGDALAELAKLANHADKQIDGKAKPIKVGETALKMAGAGGKALLELLGPIDPITKKQMEQAIEDGVEQVINRFPTQVEALGKALIKGLSVLETKATPVVDGSVDADLRDFDLQAAFDQGEIDAARKKSIDPAEQRAVDERRAQRDLDNALNDEAQLTSPLLEADRDRLGEVIQRREAAERKQDAVRAAQDAVDIANGELARARMMQDPVMRDRAVAQAEKRVAEAEAERLRVSALPVSTFVQQTPKLRVEDEAVADEGPPRVRIGDPATDLDAKQDLQAEQELEAETEQDALMERGRQLARIDDGSQKNANRTPADAKTEAQKKFEQHHESHDSRKQEIHLGDDTPATPPSQQAQEIRAELEKLNALRKAKAKGKDVDADIGKLMSSLDQKLADPAMKDALLDPHVVFALARESAGNKGLPSSPALKKFLSDNIDAVRSAQDQARQGVNPELRAKREIFEREIAIAILSDDRVKGMVDANLDEMCAKAIDYMTKSREGADRDKGLAELGLDPLQKAYAGAVSIGADNAANAKIMMDVLQSGNVRERMIALGAFAELVARDMALDPAKFEKVASSATEQGGFTASDVANYRARLTQFMTDTGGFKGDPNNEKEVKGFFGSFLKPSSVEKSGDQSAYQTAKGQDMDAKIPSVFLTDTDEANPLAPKVKESGMGEDSSLARSSLTVAQAQALGMHLSKREIDAAEKNGGRLPLNIGSIANVVDPSADFIHQGSQMSMPQKAGISGTTFRFMQAASLLGGDPKMSRLAMVGALQAIDAHTIYEIAHAAAGFGKNGEMAFDPSRPYDNLGIDPDILADIARATGSTLEELNGGTQVQEASSSSSTAQVTLPTQSEQKQSTEQKTGQSEKAQASDKDFSSFPKTADEARERKASGESFSNEDVRDYYNTQNSQIPALDIKWQQEGKTLEERAKLASQLRHGMRMVARDMMGDSREILGLLVRDAKKYGDGEGPTWDEVVQQQVDRGLTGDAVYLAIIEGSQKTDKATNDKVKKGSAPPDFTMPEGVTVRGDYAEVTDTNGSKVMVRIKGEDGNTAPYIVRNGDGTFEVRFGRDMDAKEATRLVAAQLGNIQSEAQGNTGASSGMKDKESTYGGNEVSRDNSRSVRAGVQSTLPTISNLFPPGTVTTVSPTRVAITVGGTSHLVDIKVASGSLPVATDVANFDMTTTPITITLSGTILDEHVERALSHELSEIQSRLQQDDGGKKRSATHNALATDSSAMSLSHDDIGKLGELRVLTNDLKVASSASETAEARAELVRLLKELGMTNTDGTAFNTNGLGQQRRALLEAEGVDFDALGDLLGFKPATKRPNNPGGKLRGTGNKDSEHAFVDVTADDVRPLLQPDVVAAFAEFGLSEETVVQYIVNHHNDRSQQRYLADLEGLTNQHADLDHADVMLIDLYTTKLFYKELNTRLRTGENKEAAIALAKRLNIALEKLPARTDSVFRSINIKKDQLAEFLAKHAEGEDIDWDSYSSVASDINGTMPKDNIVFIVENATAYDITDFADGMAYKETPNPGRELLVPAGAKLKVKKVDEVSPGKYHITMVQVGSGGL